MSSSSLSCTTWSDVLSVVSFETRACEVRGGRCVAGAECRPNCNGTVAYAFLSEAALPLWPVWHKYFAGCPAGSSIALVHSQNRTVRDFTFHEIQRLRHDGGASVLTCVLTTRAVCEARPTAPAGIVWRSFVERIEQQCEES